MTFIVDGLSPIPLDSVTTSNQFGVVCAVSLVNRVDEEVWLATSLMCLGVDDVLISGEARALS